MSPIDKDDPEFKEAIDLAHAQGAALALQWVSEVLDGQGPASIHPSIDTAYQNVRRRIRQLQRK